MSACLLALTRVDLAAQAQDGLADARPHDRAVLGLVVDDLVGAALDVLARRLAPRGGEGGEGLEFVSCSLVLGYMPHICYIPVSMVALGTGEGERTPKRHDVLRNRALPRPRGLLLLGLHGGGVVLGDEAGGRERGGGGASQQPLRCNERTQSQGGGGLLFVHAVLWTVWRQFFSFFFSSSAGLGGVNRTQESARRGCVLGIMWHPARSYRAYHGRERAVSGYMRVYHQAHIPPTDQQARFR